MTSVCLVPVYTICMSILLSWCPGMNIPVKDKRFGFLFPEKEINSSVSQSLNIGCCSSKSPSLENKVTGD